MFGLFKSIAPAYRGTPQASSSNGAEPGLLDRLVSGTQPAYRGAGQSASSVQASGWFTSQPHYRAAATPVVEARAADSPECAPAAACSCCAEQAEPVPAQSNAEGCDLELDAGEPLLARVPVTIVIRRSDD